VAVKQARALKLKNFSVLCNHVLTPAAMHAILDTPSGTRLDGFVGPAHVSTVIGSRPYEPFARDYRKPVVIAGFEPLDVMQAILMLIRQINAGCARVENEFIRAVTPDGNRKAQALMDEVFELRDHFEWRGLGTIAHSALKPRPAYAAHDAEARFGLEYRPVSDSKACECGAILRGEKRPAQCGIFGTVCTPDNPIGSCMVSAEGACAAHYNYGRFREPSTGTHAPALEDSA
jgi:hydrogenase expression/formation protein HypD